MEQFWGAISLIGEPELWIVLPGLLLVFYLIIRKARPDWRYRRQFKAFLLILIPSMVVVLGTTYLTKLAFPVDRSCAVCTGPGEPAGCNPYCEGDASFPSGHAGAAFTAFTALYILGKKNRKRNLLIFIIPVLVIASRLALGVHTVADIFVGSLLAIGLTAIVWFYLERNRAIS